MLLNSNLQKPSEYISEVKQEGWVTSGYVTYFAKILLTFFHFFYKLFFSCWILNIDGNGFFTH